MAQAYLADPDASSPALRGLARGIIVSPCANGPAGVRGLQPDCERIELERAFHFGPGLVDAAQPSLAGVV